LYFNTRDQGGDAPGTRGEAFSPDAGATFSPSGDDKYRWFRPGPPALDAPVVQCSLLRAASTLDGDELDVILFAGPDDNGPTGKGRSDLRIRVSTDEARSWRDGLLVHTGPAAYSDMIRLDNARVGVLFEAGEPSQGTYDSIRFVSVPLSDMLSGADARP
jgi:sialidase-1